MAKNWVNQKWKTYFVNSNEQKKKHKTNRATDRYMSKWTKKPTSMQARNETDHFFSNKLARRIDNWLWDGFVYPPININEYVFVIFVVVALLYSVLGSRTT